MIPRRFDVSRLLWLDCLGGLCVGILVLAICSWIATWHNLPQRLVVAIGFANLVYGSFSLTIAIRSKRPMWTILSLSIANMVWMFVCATIVIAYWEQMTWLGVVHIGGEGLYVGGLGLVEFRYRERLVGR